MIHLRDVTIRVGDHYLNTITKITLSTSLHRTAGTAFLDSFQIELAVSHTEALLLTSQPSWPLDLWTQNKKSTPTSWTHYRFPTVSFHIRQDLNGTMYAHGETAANPSHGHWHHTNQGPQTGWCELHMTPRKRQK